MKNLYQKSNLLSKKQFNQLEKAFDKSWSKETTFPNNLPEWTEENKALGQCAPTSIIVNDLFGGRIIYDKANFHIWNELPDGSEQDFSRKQFTDNRKFRVYKYKTREEILTDELGTRTDLRSRYELLKQTVLENLKK